MATDNIALVRRYIDQVWNKGSMSDLEQLSSSGVKTHDPLLGDIEGIEASRQHVRQLRNAFPDFHVNIDDIAAVGDKVFVRWTATGTHKGTLMGIQPTNRQGHSRGITINRFENGKLVETWYAWDVYKLAQQIGLLPPLDALTKKQAQQQQAAPH